MEIFKARKSTSTRIEENVLVKVREIAERSVKIC